MEDVTTNNNNPDGRMEEDDTAGGENVVSMALDPITPSTVNAPEDEFDEAPSFDELKATQENDNTMLLDPDSTTTSPDGATTNDQIITDPSSSMEDQPHYVSAETLSQIEMLRSDNLNERVTAMTVLSDIAVALGKDRCQKELVPFLTDSTDDEDEVLLAMAEHIPSILPHLSSSSIHLLFQPLEKLLMVEEITVREKATSSCFQIYQHILQLDNSSDKEKGMVYYSDMIQRLATKEWFTARMSACTFLSHDLATLQNTNNINEDVFVDLFAKLCRDEVPMVRRMASRELGPFFQKALETYGTASLTDPHGSLNTILIPIYEELIMNDQDAIRLTAADNCIAFGKAISMYSTEIPPLSQEELLERILPIFIATTEDRSWRVRWTTASKFNEAVEAFFFSSSSITTSMEAHHPELIRAFERLIQDPEAEVRTAATFNLGEVARCVHNNSDEQDEEEGDSPLTVAGDIVMRLVKKVSVLADDEAEHVRAALALVVSELAPTLGKKLSIQHLLPSISLLLRDSSSDVRLNMISSLGPLSETLGSLELLHSVLMPAIMELSSPEGEQASKWRIRLSVIAHMPLLAEQLGQVFFNEQKLTSLCVSWLGDEISSVREAAATNVMNLAAVFGPTWALEYICPPIMELKRHPSYLRRLAAVQAASLLATKMGDYPDTLRNIVPLILEMASDAVPNIRFNVAKALFRIAEPCGESVYKQQIRPVISVLTEDPDRDVRFFAEKSLQDADSLFGTNVVMS